MHRTTNATIALVVLAAALAAVSFRQVHAQAHHPAPAQADQAPPPSIGSIEPYLIDRDTEIALARTAAPEDISRDATVLVLGRHGYEVAVKGANGFTCLVERGWTGPLASITFSPKIHGPDCLNPLAARFVLPIHFKRTEQALAGKTKEQIIEWTAAAYAKGELPPFEPGGVAYMMSKAASLTPNGGNLAHLMFYTPVVKASEWGSDVPNSPLILHSQGPPEPFNIFLVPVGKWSDGTSAPLPK